MTMGQMWPEESKAIGLDPMKIQYQTSSTSCFPFFDNLVFYATGSTQYRYYGNIPIGARLSACIAEMLPLEGKVIGVDPMKRQCQMPTVSRIFYTVRRRHVAENSPYWT